MKEIPAQAQAQRPNKAILRNGTGDMSPLGLLRRYPENEKVEPRSEQGRARKSRWYPG